MADWPGAPLQDSATLQPAPQQPAQQQPSVSVELAPQAAPELNPALTPFVKRESGGKPFVGYTPPGKPLVDLSSAPLDETGFPIWSGNRDPNTGLMSHAAGILQIQPNTWRPIAQKLGIHDFSLESQIKVANELHKEQGTKPWDLTQWPGASVSSGNWKVDPKAISFEQGRPDTSVVYMAPDEYLQMVPTTESDRTVSRSLARSLALGEDIAAIPTLDVKRDGESVKVVDQDGRKRAMAAKEAGVDLIPVAIHGATGDAKQIVGMGGQVKPLDFKPVPKIEKPPESGFRRYLNESLAALGTGARQLPSPIMDVGLGAVGLGGLLAHDTADVFRGKLTSEPQEDLVGQAVDVLGNAATALTGGLAGPIAPEIQATRAVSKAPPPSVSLAEREPIPPSRALVPQPQSVETDPLHAQNVNRFNSAVDLINQRHTQDLAAGGATREEISRQLQAGRATGQQLVPADVAGENVRALLGNVAREPGPARETVKRWAVNRLGDIDRDSPMAADIDRGIEANLATGSAKTEARRLAEQRSAGFPLWNKAMEGGSTAPLSQQFENALDTANAAVTKASREVEKAEARVTQASAKQSQAGDRVHSVSAANRARQFADDTLKEARTRLQQEQQQKEEILSHLRKSYEDGELDVNGNPRIKGAVYSPRIARLLTNPRIKQGIARGAQIERDIADGEGRAFNPREYAIVGTDAAGEPIVGQVPNMKLIAVAKEGLDAMLESEAYRDPLTRRLNKAGRAVKILRDGLINEVDRLNPDYKPARDKWAGDSAVISALKDGQNFNKWRPEDVKEFFDESNESEKEAFRIGAADTMRDNLSKTVIAGDPSKAIVNSARARQQLVPMFRTESDATQFLDRVKRARTMFNTPVEVLRGSPTAAREAEDIARREGLESAATALHAAHAAAMLTHNPVAGVNSMLRVARRLGRNQGTARDPLLNDVIANLLLNPNAGISQAGNQLLAKAPLPNVQNMLVRNVLRYNRRFISPGGMP